MFDMIEGALATRTATDPTSPLVVSVPHAGVAHGGFERTMNPELDVRCDADLFVDRLYRVGEPDGPEVYVAAQTSRFVCDLNRDPDDVSVGRRARAPGAAQHRRPRLHLGDHDDGRPDPVAPAGVRRVARADRHSRRVSRRHRRARWCGRATLRLRHPARRPLHAVARAHAATRIRDARAPTSSPAIATAPAARRR